ncbi:hypothetical protein OUZ56_002996 [Daphnia magna]|uniref:Secreted protein n=1 Tax=Daphnia magna TaxID=35525 RepID=A0ABR0A7E8_9CRUS|nr:hypothetical protein OUZ56_002996 [Daphnia magna]
MLLQRNAVLPQLALVIGLPIRTASVPVQLSPHLPKSPQRARFISTEAKPSPCQLGLRHDRSDILNSKVAKV